MARKPPKTRAWVTEMTLANEQRALRLPRKRMCELAEFIAAAERRPVEALDVLVVGDARMAALNERHLGHSGPTDVLSFVLGHGPAGGPCVQLVLCAAVARRQARRRGHAAWKELMLYLAHGLLHAMGYDDLKPAGAARMHAREDELLEAFGIGRVYDAGP